MGMGVLVWGLVGAVMWALPADISIRTQAIVRMPSSTLNSACLLLAAAYFDYGPFALKPLQARKSQRIAIFVATGLVASITLALTWVYADAARDWKPWAIPDVLLSLVTLGILGAGLFHSFQERKEVSKYFGLIAYLAVGAVVFQGAAQIPEVYDFRWPSESGRYLMLLASKVAVISVFFMLLISSLYERQARPSVASMALRFTSRLDPRHRHAVLVTIPGVCVDSEVWLSQRPFKTLQLFAATAINAATKEESFVKLLEQGLYAAHLRTISEQMSERFEKRISYTLLFENDWHGGYRLFVPPSNIKFERDSWVLDLPHGKIVFEDPMVARIER